MTTTKFPAEKLTQMADYWANIAHLWRRNPEPRAKELRLEMLENEKLLRRAIAAYVEVAAERDELANLCDELQGHLASMMKNAEATAV